MNTPNSRRAFTLLELIVVLSIAAVLAGLAMLSLRSHFDQAALATAVDRLMEADRQSRQLAQQKPSGQVDLRIDTLRNRATIGDDLKTFQLPKRVKIAQPQVLLGASWRTPSRAVGYGTSGTSSTYSIQLSAGASQRWLVVFGLSGMHTMLESSLQLAELTQ